MHHIVLAATLSLLSTPAFAQMITLSPARIGEIFCIARLGNDMAPVEGLLTAGLAAAIAEAQLQNDAIQKAHPDEKPPLGDGIPWQSFQDYADQCKAGAATLMMDDAVVPVDFAFTDYPDANFTDLLQLRLVDDPTAGSKVWRIDNVAYANAGDLRAALVSAFEN